MKKLLPIVLCALIASCSSTPTTTTLTILHTNDTHSQVEPNGKNLGGYARRMGFIEQERATDPDLLLLDAGDFSQGSPYFNFFHGRIEIEALNKMGYDAATLGNHEFDNGIDTLAAILKLANFPIVCANYKVSGTPLEGLVKPYIIIKKKGLKIGIFGLGVEPGSLIGEKNFFPLEWQEPYPIAQETASMLRNEKKCDVVICLSHMGTEMEEGEYSDTGLAAATRDIDLIIGGHTHRVYELVLKNIDGKDVIVRQTGKSGINVGKVLLNVEKR